MALPKIAASSYLNSAPLLYSFLSGSQRHAGELISHTAPSRCAELLANGEVAAALIPAIEYQRIPNIRIVPDVAVAAKREVRSVVLASKAPMEDVGSVALDTSSRTSAALIQILYREYFGRLPKLEPAAPDLPSMLERHDAALIIGDPAILADRSRLHVYDLAAEWRKRTGLPFVFAFWCARDGEEGALRDVDFARARDEGVTHRHDIARQYSASLGLPVEDLLSYLEININYHLDQENLRGLRLFFALAAKHGLVPAEKPLVFAEAGDTN